MMRKKVITFFLHSKKRRERGRKYDEVEKVMRNEVNTLFLH